MEVEIFFIGNFMELIFIENFMEKEMYVFLDLCQMDVRDYFVCKIIELVILLIGKLVEEMK